MSSFVVALELVVSHPQPRFVERSRFPELSIICKQLIIYRLARVRHNYIEQQRVDPGERPHAGCQCGEDKLLTEMY